MSDQYPWQFAQRQDDLSFCSYWWPHSLCWGTCSISFYSPLRSTCSRSYSQKVHSPFIMMYRRFYVKEIKSKEPHFSDYPPLYLSPHWICSVAGPVAESPCLIKATACSPVQPEDYSHFRAFQSTSLPLRWKSFFSGREEQLQGWNFQHLTIHIHQPSFWPFDLQQSTKFAASFSIPTPMSALPHRRQISPLCLFPEHDE